jgi:hypothetical protein
MGPEARFTRVVDALAGSDGPARRQPAGRVKPGPGSGKRFDDSTELVEVRARRSLSRAVEGPTPPTPSPVGQGRRTAGKRQNQNTAGNEAGSGRCSQTAETPPVVKTAEYWHREAKTATEPLILIRPYPGTVVQGRYRGRGISGDAVRELAAGVG